VPFLLLSPPFFPDYTFHVHHPVNWDDRHLLALAMASDISVKWQLSKRKLLFLLGIKLHAHICTFKRTHLLQFFSMGLSLWVRFAPRVNLVIVATEGLHKKGIKLKPR
jgi:hypothetical protein